MATGMALAAQQKQEKDLVRAFAEAKAPYQPGGTFGAGVEAGLERGRVKATTAGMQSLVSAGLAGTSMGAGLGKKYEEEVAAPIRLQVESQRSQALSGIQMAYLDMMYRIQEAKRQRTFLAEQGAAGRQTQLTLGQPPAMQPAARHGPSASQFPTLYGVGAEGLPSTPNWMSPQTSTPTFTSSLPQPQTPAPVGAGGFDFGPPTSYYGAGGGWMDWK